MAKQKTLSELIEKLTWFNDVEKTKEILRRLVAGTGGGKTYLEEGTNITLVGEGTEEDPIVISSTGGGAGGATNTSQLINDGENGVDPFITFADISFLIPHPSYTAPTASITNVSGTFEVGDTQAISITLGFNQNDAGGITARTITKNGSTVSTTASFSESLGITLGDTTYGGSVTHNQGNCKNNIGGVQDCTGRINAGTVTAPTRTVVGAYRRFSGSVATIPTDGTALRTALLSTSVINTSNSFTFTTGTVNRRFVIAIPSAKNLQNVTNTGTNEDLTSGFVLSGTITTVPDAGGTNRAYKVYVMENAVPFSTNYTIQVTLN